LPASKFDSKPVFESFSVAVRVACPAVEVVLFELVENFVGSHMLTTVLSKGAWGSSLKILSLAAVVLSFVSV